MPGAADAEDVTSGVFVRALRSWDRYDPSLGTPEAWLYTIASRTVTDWWRRHRRDGEPREAPVEGFGALAAPGPGPEDEAVRREGAEELGRALAELPEREREAIALRFSGGLKAREVGEVLACSEGAAKMLVYRGVRRLREVMAP